MSFTDTRSHAAHEEVPVDAEEARRARARRLEKTGRWLFPMLIMVLAIIMWDRICVWNEIPRYILPRPGEVLATLITVATTSFPGSGSARATRSSAATSSRPSR